MEQTSKPTAEQLKQGQQIIFAVAETIREAKEVPSGTIYAALVGRVSFEGYQKILQILTNAGLISIDRTHLIKWVAA